MKIKIFRQKRQAAEEKRKEERSALETVRMEHLISNEPGLRLLIIYCHWSGREEAEGGGEGGGEGLGPHEDCQGAGAAVRCQHRGYGRYLHKNDAVIVVVMTLLMFQTSRSKLTKCAGRWVSSWSCLNCAVTCGKLQGKWWCLMVIEDISVLLSRVSSIY